MYDLLKTKEIKFLESEVRQLKTLAQQAQAASFNNVVSMRVADLQTELAIIVQLLHGTSRRLTLDSHPAPIYLMASCCALVYQHTTASYKPRTMDKREGAGLEFLAPASSLGVRDRLQSALRVFAFRSLSAALAMLPIIAIHWIDSQECKKTCYTSRKYQYSK
ncbi:hypothetical protein GQX74_002013 [Glossina fuscipes]|nr:hypothetical protein GQX74_002013 [Glossina fuscipes]